MVRRVVIHSAHSNDRKWMTFARALQSLRSCRALCSHPPEAIIPAVPARRQRMHSGEGIRSRRAYSIGQRLRAAGIRRTAPQLAERRGD
eukprot:5825639-Pyramimonas_sp.AAC.1